MLFPESLALKEDATSAKIKSLFDKFQYIHFAAHGEASWDDAYSSFIATSDKPLTISDLTSSFKTCPPRMISLSACETGVSDFKNLPSASLGMDTLLIRGGVACVLSSLWIVSDAAAFLLMRKFYENHVKVGVEPIEALARAQRWLRALNEEEVRRELGEVPQTVRALPDYPFSSPFYWAAFRVLGQ